MMAGPTSQSCHRQVPIGDTIDTVIPADSLVLTVLTEVRPQQVIDVDTETHSQTVDRALGVL